MPVRFHCPHCNSYTEVADEFAGRKGPCKHCGRPITIPALHTQGPQQRVLAPPAQSTGPAALLVVSGLLLLLLSVCGGGFLFYNYTAQSGSLRTWTDNQQRLACQGNLTQIMQAMLAYEADHGTFPPAYTVDAAGKRLHSWRVLLLPYLGESTLYQQIRLEEPWDSQWNKQFHSQMPDVLGCPASQAMAARLNTGPGYTNYAVVVAPGYLFQGSQPTARGDVVDGLGDTIAVVEVADADFNWMEPKDLDGTNQAIYEVNSQFGTGPSGDHPRGIHVGLADGQVKHVPNEMNPQEFKDRFTIAGGEAQRVW